MSLRIIVTRPVGEAGSGAGSDAPTNALERLGSLVHRPRRLLKLPLSWGAILSSGSSRVLP